MRLNVGLLQKKRPFFAGSSNSLPNEQLRHLLLTVSCNLSL